MSVFTHRYQHRLKCWGHDLLVWDFKSSLTPKAIEEDLNKDIFFAQGMDPAPKTILDIGANTGIVAMTLAKEYPKSKILAVECIPHNAESLRMNLLANEIHNVEILEKAVWSEPDELLKLYQTPWGSGEASIYGHSMGESFDVPTVSLNSLFERNVWDFVKIDIEGAEYEAFKTVRSWQNVKRMQIEIHERPGMPPDEDTLAQVTLHNLIGSHIGIENLTSGMLKSIWHQGKLAPDEKQPHRVSYVNGVVTVTEKE